METGNEILYKTFRYKPTDTRDKARIDDLGRQIVVDGGKEPRFRSTRVQIKTSSAYSSIKMPARYVEHVRLR